LVTGANGFVGKVVCEDAIQRGFRIKAATRSACALPTGAESTVVGAINGETDWTEALSSVDVVIHLAARVHIVKDTSNDPLSEFQRVNLHGTINLARQAARAGARRLVFVSSIKVNGESTLPPGKSSTSGNDGREAFTELDKPNPQDPYAVSKWEAEQALQRIFQETGLEVVILRPPLVYGPGVKGNFFSLLAAISKRIPLPLSGAKNARSLIYVGNLADALNLCATHPSASGQTYLVSDGEAVSTADLIDKIAHALGCPNRSFYLPPGLLRMFAALAGRSDQMDKLFGSLLVSDGKIRRELGWAPPYTLDAGLRATAEWYIAQRTGVGYNRDS
jgi:nucleoside-diphosphate-sugar epimerase